MEEFYLKVYLFRPNRVPPIKIARNSQLRITIETMDYTIPEGATASAFTKGAFTTKIYTQSCTVDGNRVSFIPEPGFFVMGRNILQYEIGGGVIPLAIDVSCEISLPDGGEAVEPEQVLPLVQRAENAAIAAEADAKSADVSAVAAAGSAQAALESRNAAETSANAAAGSAEVADKGKESAEAFANAAAWSANAADISRNAAEASANAAAGSADVAADSASAAAGAATAAGESAAAAEESAQAALESKNAAADSAAAAAEVLEQVASVIPDDSAVDGKPWTSKKIVDSLCMPFAESGNPVQVYPVEGYPLGVKVSWEPVQDGDGDPSPDNIRPIVGLDSVKVNRTGKNLLDFSSFANYTNWRMDIATEGDSPTTPGNKGYILPVKPSKTYTISFEFLGDTFASYLYIVKSINGVSERHAYITTEKIITKVVSFTPADNEIWYLRIGSTNNEDLFNAKIEKITNIQLELGSTATPCEPYTGSTTDIALPETVYGGTLDVESGVVTVTLGHIASYAGETLPGEWISDRDTYSADAVPTTGAQVVYKLPTPYTIQIPPKQIAALSGANTILTDADSVVVTGAEDPKHTISELKNAIISLGGNI